MGPIDWWVGEAVNLGKPRKRLQSHKTSLNKFENTEIIYFPITTNETKNQ